jgi:hypothetical protein
MTHRLARPWTLRVLLLICALAVPPTAQAHDPLAVTARPVPLNPEAPAQRQVGGLRWRGGLELRSPDSRFGGLSALLVEADGRDLLALTDTGHLVAGRLTYDADGNLSGLEDARITALRDIYGRPLKGKAQKDAEALARGPDGGLLVAFEVAHRLWRYPADLARRDGRPQPLLAPPGLGDAPINGGMEALTSLSDGGLLALTEDQETGGGLAAYLRRDARWSTLVYRPHGAFRPSGAALLPDGDVLVLERAFSLLGGLRSRLVRLPGDSIQPGAILQAREIARLRPPLTHDNLEAVAARRGASGETLIYLVSDDNFSVLQDTLLLMFELAE